MIERIPVKSSQIKGIGWAPNQGESVEGKGTLEVEFTSLAVYQYANVPYTEYRMLLAADSKGSHFAKQIRGAFEYIRLHVEGCGGLELSLCVQSVQCPCWCHKQRKDVSHGETKVPNPSLSQELRKSIQKAKAEKKGA